MGTLLLLRVDARAESIGPLRDAVGSIASHIGLSDSQLYGVKLCVTEAVTNAVVHAYPDDEPGPLDVRVRHVADEVEIVVADHGREAHGELPHDHAGFGLGFISRLTDRCTFTAAAHGARVEMRFPLPRSARYRFDRPLISGPGRGTWLSLVPGR